MKAQYQVLSVDNFGQTIAVSQELHPSQSAAKKWAIENAKTLKTSRISMRTVWDLTPDTEEATEENTED